MFARRVAGYAEAECVVHVSEEEEYEDRCVNVSIELPSHSMYEACVFVGDKQTDLTNGSDEVVFHIRTRDHGDWTAAVLGQALIEAGKEILRLQQVQPGQSWPGFSTPVSDPRDGVTTVYVASPSRAA